MELPKKIAAAKLADRANPTARAIWAAVKRGEVRVTWDGVSIVGMSIDNKRD